MQLDRIFLINLLPLILLMGCSTQKDSIAISSLPRVNNQFAISVIWHCSVGGGSKGYYSQLTPCYSDSVVYAADRKGIVKAIDINSGKILWTIDLSQQSRFFTTNFSALLSSGLTISGDKIYIGTEVGKVIVLNKANGKIVWEACVSGEVVSHPVVSEGLVLVHTSNGMLQALDIHSGQNKWSINLNSSTTIFSIRGKSAPAVAYGVAIVGSNSGRVSAIALPQGKVLWQQCIISQKIYDATKMECLHDINMTPIIDVNLGLIYAIAYNGDLVAIDMRSTQIIWRRQNLGSVNNIAVTRDVIYLVDQNDRVLAIRKSDGVTLWVQSTLLYRNLTAPVIYDSYLVVGDREGYLHWLDIRDGQFVAQNKIDSSGLHSPPVIASDKLLIQAIDGTVYLIKH